MSQIEETQWRSFRQINRNRPFKQFRILFSIALSASLYAYALFGLQPEQSHASVVQWNIKEGKREIEELRRMGEVARERRKDLLRRREAARIRRNNTSFAGKVTTNLTTFGSGNKTVPLSSGQAKIETHTSAFLRFYGLLGSFIISMFMCSAARFVLRLCLPPPPMTSHPRRSRRPREDREARFREWARRLNRQREQQGERPLSIPSLRLVVRGRDFTSGNDYEGLLQFNEEAGPAMQALLQSMGATQGEINRCPKRTVRAGDDLLQPVPGKDLPRCAVCLEAYAANDEVRTIPCFHTFHTRCIDLWLSQKAECPVCKHPALG
jgi:hypothetical protein